MARHFTKVCTANEYAAMEGSLKRPTTPGKVNRSIGDSMGAEAAKARRMAAAKTKKKK